MLCCFLVVSYFHSLSKYFCILNLRYVVIDWFYLFNQCFHIWWGPKSVLFSDKNWHLMSIHERTLWKNKQKSLHANTQQICLYSSDTLEGLLAFTSVFSLILGSSLIVSHSMTPLNCTHGSLSYFYCMSDMFSRTCVDIVLIMLVL